LGAIGFAFSDACAPMAMLLAITSSPAPSRILLKTLGIMTIMVFLDPSSNGFPGSQTT
jgi:hypothetical protein